MGESSATIRNKQKDELYFYCTSGSVDPEAGIFLKLHDLSPAKGEKIYVQIIVDGQNYPLEFDEIRYRALGRAFYQDIYSLVKAISTSKSKYFNIEIPDKGIERSFSLLNARENIGVPPKSLIDPCK